MEQRANRRRFLTGTVVSDKMNKTRVIQVRKIGKHAKYLKMMQGFVRYKAHDEENKAKMGDVVVIMETRPISKDKRWVIEEIITGKKAK